MLAMNYLWNVHSREKLIFNTGKNCTLISNKKHYLDFSAGGAVNSLGYGNKGMIKAITKQANKIWHLSNYYTNKPAEELAKTLCLLSGLEKAFFTNSGTEGVEFAIKVARKFFRCQNIERFEIISLKNCFHGRTMGSLSTSSNPKYLEGFEPFLEGFVQAELSIKSIESKITPQTSAIILEPIQGEGGLTFLGWNFLQEIRKLCNKYGILMILDEVQTGIGRTGTFFAFEQAEIKPDIVVLSKGIAGGFPFGCVLSTKKIADCIGISQHGGTFGGNLLGVQVAREVVKQISKKEFLSQIVKSSIILDELLKNMLENFPDIIEEIRGFGLMRGLKINKNIEVKNLVHQIIKKQQLLCGTAGENVLRITPPLIIKPAEIKDGISRIANALHFF